tara:strand:+ start:254 stop:1210 length:957 start_codon:yes stop_codon:yes gene_type:complete
VNDNKFIVTTSIYPPSEATIKFSQMRGWTLVVVGDKKTPHDLYKKINCIYLSPEDQEKLHKPLSDSIGWNKIMRRNMGFLYAYQHGADIVATIDDDNIPYDNWGENISVGKEVSVDVWENENGFFDPLSVTNHNEVWHRGYPLELTETKNNVKLIKTEKITPLIQADLWDGDPDIDAICRLATRCNLNLEYEGSSDFYTSENLSPFNSQNTFVHREAIPHYMVLPYVGRMDDIWGGYIIQKELGNKCIVYNSKATVYQHRNKQDLLLNLENEIVGYRNTSNLLNGDISLDKIKNPFSDDRIDCKKAAKSYEIYKKAFK